MICEIANERTYQPNRIMISKIKTLANNLNYECIEDGQGVCVRPMLFDEEGKRIVRYKPDACEYMSEEEAFQKLMEKKKAYDCQQ